jgi:hypothetical protein
MRQSIWLWATPLVVVLIGLAVYTHYDFQRDDAAPAEVDAADVAGSPAEQPPAAAVPEPAPAPAVVLPPLDESDEVVQSWLSEQLDKEAVGQLLRPERIVRRFVTTNDNLSRDEVALRHRPVESPAGKFLASSTQTEGAFTLSSDNYRRYAPFVNAVDRVDAAALVATYHRMYPLLQRAYEDLGYPDESFNTRLIETVDHLLATPDVKESVKLVRPRVLYEFADPELEALSEGQKLLLRMGPEQANIVKAKLRQVRAELVKQAYDPEHVTGPQRTGSEQGLGPRRRPTDTAPPG